MHIVNPICLSGNLDNENYRRFVPEFMALCKSIAQDELVTICINSNGGDTHVTFGLYDLIKSCERRTIALVMGHAESGAAIILQACSRRLMTANSSLMLHLQTVRVGGNVQDARSALIRFEEMDRSMAQIIADRSSTPIEDVLTMMRSDTYFNAHSALSNGLVDEVAD